MAESSNFVVFKRDSQGSESQEDVWDDTALIQAYDRAVNLAKEKVAAKLGLSHAGEVAATESEGSFKKSPKKSSSQKKGWKVGDHVRCVYSEDGVVYEAVIETINSAEGTCQVKYLGYDNEEEVSLNNLEPSAGPAARRQQLVDAGEDVESSDDMECEAAIHLSSAKGSATIPPELKWQPVRPAGTKLPGASMPAPPDSGFGILPPPPPAAWPKSTAAAGEMESDALYSMLMSWYMAGYHTGLYQGLRQKANNSKSGV